MNVKIRPETPADQRAIWNMNRAAFGSASESDLVDALRAGGYVNVSLVAEVENEIVGHILFSKLTIVTRTGASDAVCLAPMAVLPSQQLRGIGGKLIVEGLDQCRSSGHKIVAVLGHPALYQRFGFSVELAKSLESPFGGGEAWMIAELTPGSMSGLIGRVDYPPPFTSLS